jgi:hypothetical protein
VRQHRLDTALATITWRRGQHDELKTDMSVRIGGKPIRGVKMQEAALTGKVVGPDGAPVSDAQIWTWQSELDGGAKSISLVPFPATTSGDDGTFEMVWNGTAIAAEHGDLRSAPRSITSGIELRLRPTHTVHGKIVSQGDPLTGVDGCVVIRGRDWMWVERGPGLRDGTFTIDHVPEGEWTICATDGVHRVDGAGGVVHWSAVAPLDVIVHGAKGEAPVWVFRGTVAPRTRAQLDALAARASDLGHDSAEPVGQGDATDAGRAFYGTGDLHVVIDGNAPGPVTACVAREDNADVPVACASHVMHAPAFELRQQEGSSHRGRALAPAEVVEVTAPPPAATAPR